MHQFDRWRVGYDLDNRSGFIELWPVGVPSTAAPFRLAPLNPDDFTACCGVLNAARVAGGRPTWDPASRSLFF